MKDSPTSFKELVRSSVKESENFESNEDYLKNTFKPITTKDRHTIAALSIQLKDSQQLLSMQQQEAIKTAEHIDMLNSVIDSLNATIKQQNQESSSLRQANSVLKEALDKAEQNKDHAHVERKTFIELEEQAKSLLQTIKEKNQEIADLTIELKYLREMRQDNVFVDEMRLKHLEETNISLPLENQKLSSQLTMAQDLNTSLRKRVSVLEERVAELEFRLRRQEESTVESMAKVNKLEFESILRLDRLFEESRDVERREEQLKQRILVFKENNSELQGQLRESVSKIELVESVCGGIVDHAERTLAEKKAELSNLRIDNKKLRLEVRMLREIIEKASQRGQYYVLGEHGHYEYSAPGEGRALDLEAPSLHRLPPDLVSELHLTTPTQTGGTISASLSKIHPKTKFGPTGTSLNLSATGSVPTPTGLEQRDRGVFPIIDMLNARQGLFFLDMKNQMLENYLRLSAATLCFSAEMAKHDHSTVFSPDFLAGLVTSAKVINLANCSLVDHDIATLVGILRKIPSVSLIHLEKIDLSGNHLTNEGVSALFSWYLSLSIHELTGRKKKLEIDCQTNKIRLDLLGEIKKLFRLRPEIYRVDFLATNNDTLIVFGESRPGDLPGLVAGQDEDYLDMELEDEKRVGAIAAFNFNGQRGWKTARNPNALFDNHN